MKQNYLLTLLGTFLLTLFSCQKADLASEGASSLNQDVSSTSYYDYCDHYCDYDCDKYCEHDCDNHKGCTLTQGYWKNHPEDWPVDELTLGNVTYSDEELLEILRTPVRGNGLIALAHQLIAAKLNIEAGASDNEIEDAIDDADDLIGNLDILAGASLPTSETSSLVDELASYNEGEIGPGHCDD